MSTIIKKIIKKIWGKFQGVYYYFVFLHYVLKIKIFKIELTAYVTGTAGDNVPAEIEYRDKNGKVLGFWAYGDWHPDYPYKGEQLK